jgi:hypothetical protein
MPFTHLLTRPLRDLLAGAYQCSAPTDVIWKR